MGAGFHGGFGGTHGNKEKHKDYIENTLPKRVRQLRFLLLLLL